MRNVVKNHTCSTTRYVNVKSSHCPKSKKPPCTWCIVDVSTLMQYTKMRS